MLIGILLQYTSSPCFRCQPKPKQVWICSNMVIGWPGHYINFIFVHSCFDHASFVGRIPIWLQLPTFSLINQHSCWWNHAGLLPLYVCVLVEASASNLTPWHNKLIAKFSRLKSFHKTFSICYFKLSFITKKFLLPLFNGPNFSRSKMSITVCWMPSTLLQVFRVFSCSFLLVRMEPFSIPTICYVVAWTYCFLNYFFVS